MRSLQSLNMDLGSVEWHFGRQYKLLESCDFMKPSGASKKKEA